MNNHNHPNKKRPPDKYNHTHTNHSYNHNPLISNNKKQNNNAKYNKQTTTQTTLLNMGFTRSTRSTQPPPGNTNNSTHITKHTNKRAINNNNNNNDNKPYLHAFVCQQCNTGHQSNQHTPKLTTTFKCIERCLDSKTNFNNKRAYKSWKNHHNKYHTCNQDYLHITQRVIANGGVG